MDLTVTIVMPGGGDHLTTRAVKQGVIHRDQQHVVGGRSHHAAIGHSAWLDDELAFPVVARVQSRQQRGERSG
jgi:hypothetical protein